MTALLNTVLIYARNMHKSAEFYRKHFGFTTSGNIEEGLINLYAPAGGTNIVIHQAAKSVKLGQVGVKLVFSVKDIEAFRTKAATMGLKFGVAHEANGYAFANAKDPDKNNVCISSRAFRVNPS